LGASGHLTTADVAGLANVQRLPCLIAMTCLVGEFSIARRRFGDFNHRTLDAAFPSGRGSQGRVATHAGKRIVSAAGTGALTAGAGR
jgi:hypothetical protein